MVIVKKLFKILKIFETSSQNKNKKERVRDTLPPGRINMVNFSSETIKAGRQ